MKISPSSLTALLTLSLALIVVGDTQSRDLTPSEFRRFCGRYVGSVSGIAGNASKPQANLAFDTAIVVSSRPMEMLTPQISNLFTATKHRIVWRKPTGSGRRAVLVGIYSGRFNNAEGASITVRGTRKVIINDRGATAPKRYLASFSDNLKETFTITGGTSAAQDLRGTLRK